MDDCLSVFMKSDKAYGRASASFTVFVKPARFLEAKLAGEIV
jgi:hypothetical protein